VPSLNEKLELSVAVTLERFPLLVFIECWEQIGDLITKGSISKFKIWVEY